MTTDERDTLRERIARERWQYDSGMRWEDASVRAREAYRAEVDRIFAASPWLALLEERVHDLAARIAALLPPRTPDET